MNTFSRNEIHETDDRYRFVAILQGEVFKTTGITVAIPASRTQVIGYLFTETYRMGIHNHIAATGRLGSRKITTP